MQNRITCNIYAFIIHASDLNLLLNTGWQLSTLHNIWKAITYYSIWHWFILFNSGFIAILIICLRMMAQASPALFDLPVLYLISQSNNVRPLSLLAFLSPPTSAWIIPVLQTVIPHQLFIVMQGSASIGNYPVLPCSFLWNNIAPNPCNDASVSRSNRSLKYGQCSTSTLVRWVFMGLNASQCSSVQIFLSSGSALVPFLLPLPKVGEINWYKHLESRQNLSNIGKAYKTSLHTYNLCTWHTGRNIVPPGRP